MAYAATMSLIHTITSHLSSSRISADSSRESLESAAYHAKLLQEALERCSGWVRETDELVIIEESRRLEDAIEFPLSTHHFLEPAFDQLRQDVDHFANTMKKMEANIEILWEQNVAKVLEESIMKLCVPKTEKNPSPSPEEEDGCSMVGLSDQFHQIRDLLTAAKESKSYILVKDAMIWISGMAGIGKTALAKKLFHDPSVKANFKYRVFVRMDKEDYVVFENEEKIMEGDLESLGRSFWFDLSRVKSLIVFDDFQEDLHSFNYLNVIDKRKGTRILVTNRRVPKFTYKYTLEMRFLNEEESWDLLRKQVFGEEDDEEEDCACPKELVKAGKKIAEECEGLPLLIIAVAPILFSKAQKDPEAWKRVAEKPDSVLEEASLQISDQLLSNYHQISEDLKPCFLYITAFPKKYVVWSTMISYLWYAEGFIDSWETDAMPHLYSLLENYLVMGRRKGHLWHADDGDKACSLHCAYWYVSRREAENKKFLYTVNSRDDGLDEHIKGHRRLAIYTNVLFAIIEVHDFISSVATVRSLLCTGPYHPYQVPMCWDWKLLRVLSALTIRFYEFPVEVVKLIFLKYLSLTCNANLPPSVSDLWNLQFLIVHQHSNIKRVGVVSYLPVAIWDLQELEVLQIMGRNLPDPPRPDAVLPKLRKLLDVGAESCTKGVLESLPSLEKLRVQIELEPQSHAAETETTMSCIDHLSCLDQLHSFQCVVMNPIISHLPPPPLPLSFYMERIESLSLSGFGYPWKEMSNIAQLPNLKRLKLKSYAFRGEKWEVEEGISFQNLDKFYIEDTDLMQWTAADETFPRLSWLNLKNCHKLQELPLFSKWNKLRVQLVDCNPLAETGTKQRNTTLGNWFTVTATYS